MVSVLLVFGSLLGQIALAPLSSAGNGLLSVLDGARETTLARSLFGHSGAPAFEELRDARCNTHADCLVAGEHPGFFCARAEDEGRSDLANEDMTNLAGRSSFEEVHAVHELAEASAEGSGGGQHCLACRFCTAGRAHDGKCPGYCGSAGEAARHGLR